MTTVTWTQDANSNYEISSAEHLKQLINKGTLYTDAGTFPTNYWATGTNYIQTADIDLLGDSTDIKPIGVLSDEFYGIYDGGNFKISNWSYLDPNYPDFHNSESAVGLFGVIAGSVIIRNIKMTGVWKLLGVSNTGGLLVARSTTTDTPQITSIDAYLDVGSEINQGVQSSERFISLGGIIGSVHVATISGISLKGTLDFTGPFMSLQNSGGVVGSLNKSIVNGIENKATFPSGIVGKMVGGIVGNVSGNSSLNNCISCITGDLSGTNSIGGICGSLNLNGGNLENDTLVNAMTGNITCTDGKYAGGIFGAYVGNDSYNLINYMTGDISGGSGYNAGLIGLLFDGDISIFSSINAMNGNTQSTVVGTATVIGLFNTSSVLTTVTVNTSFGLTFTTNANSTTVPPSGLLTNADFTDLPYVSVAGTDSDGNEYDFDFLYANLSGNSSYSEYTHAIIHKGDVTAPFSIDFDVADSNTTMYTTFANASTETFSQPLLSVNIVYTITPTPSPVSISVSIAEVPGAIGYNVTYEGSTGGEITIVSGVTELEHNISGLVPDSAYTIRLYADSGTGYQLESELVTSTLANVATSYDKQDYEDGGFFNLTSLTTSALSAISQVWNDVFGTGDVVGVTVPKKSEFKGSFINLGDTLSIKEINGVVIPFESTSGIGQNVNVTLSDDATNVPITYDDTVNTITVDGVVYSGGDSFILDGKKVAVLDI